MSRVLEILRSRSWTRAAALTLMTIGVAACSSDVSRFHESPFGLGGDTTGLVAQGAPQGPVSNLESRPLAPQVAQARPIQPATKLAAAAPAAGSVGRKPIPAGKKPAVSAAVKENEPVQNASVVTTAPDTLDKDAAKLAEGTGAPPKFRWPANGRIIAGYGLTTNGQQNDGINIALPENTPVKAAEDGVVAYAGNELKGYGNLILVRHPNGYVTAYAHAKELLVKRGDQVKRGQVIARSGQTGNVNAPQLHFEIRKGVSPLDPRRFLTLDGMHA